MDKYKIVSNFEGSYISVDQDNNFTYCGNWANKILSMFIKLNILNNTAEKINVIKNVVIPKTSGFVIYGTI
jgi:hypothetical protein